MRNTIGIATLTVAALLAHRSPVRAQDDSTSSRRNTLEIGVDAERGLYTQVNGKDDTPEEDRPDTITFQTRRKIITILSANKVMDTTGVAAAKRRRELRRARRNAFTYWTGVELGLNNLMAPDGGFDLPEKARFMQLEDANSRFLALNLAQYKLEFGSHHAGIFTGLGLEFVNYRLSNNVRLAYDADSVFAQTVVEPDLRKNKLRQIGLRVPLMLEFNTKRSPLPTEDALRSGTWKDHGFSRKNNFHLAFGLVGSWYFDTMYKVKYRQDGDVQKERSKGSFHLLDHRLAARAQVGWGGLNLFAEYALTPLFREGRGPELVPVNAGLTLVGF